MGFHVSKIIEKLLSNSGSFSDKGGQVIPSEFNAFGIKIYSRSGKADEIIEMLKFSQDAAFSSVAHYIISVEFDSKSSSCGFELNSVSQGSEIEQEILRIAYKHFSHFWWFDEEIINT